jgi:hypothetical protein
LPPYPTGRPRSGALPTEPDDPAGLTDDPATPITRLDDPNRHSDRRRPDRRTTPAGGRGRWVQSRRTVRLEIRSAVYPLADAPALGMQANRSNQSVSISISC